MNKSLLLVSVLFLALCTLLQTTAGAARAAGPVPTVTQSVTLNPGWNAVFLEVQPLSNSPAAVFKGLPSGSSVWAWLGKDDSVQFIQDPSDPMVTKPKWLAIFASSAESSLNNLYALSANTPLLVQLPAGSAPLTLNIAGRPTIRHRGWVPDSFNLTGFGFATLPPTFASFFASSPSHKGQDIYRLNNASGAWEKVPATTAMRSGEAFWIYCTSGSDYQGPLSVESHGADGLDFGTGVTLLSLTLRNASASPLSVSVAQSDAANPRALVLDYRYNDAANAAAPMLPLAGMPAVPVPAGASSVVTLAVRRGSFSGQAASVLELSDGQGGRFRVPVTATSNAANSFPGLWSGVVTLNQVSPISGDPTATPAPLKLNLLLHQDRRGQVRLLKQVIMMHKDGSFAKNGRDVALTEDALIPNYSGVVQKDGAKVGRRLSAVGFDFSPGAAGSGATDFAGTALNCGGAISGDVSCSISLAKSAPTNPFWHRYHPDLGRETNSHQIGRSVLLHFQRDPAVNPDNPHAGWGVTELGGTYTETITGLAKGPIKVKGNFTLNLASDVDLLNE